MAWLVGITPLGHHRILAAAPAEVGAGIADDAHFLRLGVALLGIFHRLLKARRRHELLEIVRRIDNHQDALACHQHILQPTREKRDMEDDDDVGGQDGL